MKTLTIFTPTRNCGHLLRRVYECLVTQSCPDFDWLVVDDGSTDFTPQLVEELQQEQRIHINYLRLPHRGLYGACKAAYDAIDTELAMRVGPDEFLADDAVETVIAEWRERGGAKYAGVVGLDISFDTMEPLRGAFPEGLSECWFYDLYTHRVPCGDFRPAMRTALMREASTAEEFEGEKHLSPDYALLRATDTLPVLVVNNPLCIVDYQIRTDSVAESVEARTVDSPRSFAALHALELTLSRRTTASSLRAAVAYNAAAVIARRRGFAGIPKSPQPLLTWLTYLPGRLRARKILRSLS